MYYDTEDLHPEECTCFSFTAITTVKEKFNWAFLTKLFTSACFSCVFWLHIGWLSLSFHTCPIHPNCCKSSAVLDKSSHQMSNHALTYHKLRGVSNMWNYHGMPEVESCINIPDVEGCAREQWVKMSHMVQEHNNWKSIIRILETVQCSKCWWFDMIQLKSNNSSQQMTIHHTRCQFAVSCKSTSSMTGHHLLWWVLQFKLNRVDSTTSTTPLHRHLQNIF